MSDSPPTVRPLPPKAANKVRESEFFANRLFMFISGLLAVVSLAAFLWLAGVLEWRGSDGNVIIEVTLQCDKPAPTHISEAIYVNFDDPDWETVEFDMWSDAHTNLTQKCPKTKIRSNRRPQAVISAGTVDAPGDDLPIAATFLPISIGALPPLQEALIPTAERLRLQFIVGEHLHYVGLGERNVSLQFAVYAAKPRLLLQIRPPSGFYLASSQPAASLRPNDIWDIDLEHVPPELTR